MKKIFLFLFILCSIPVLIDAQNDVMDQLGGTKLNLKITTDGNTILNDTEQFIVRRASSSKDSEPVLSYASAYGHEPYHLEFLSADKLKKGDKKRSKWNYKIDFYSADGTNLFSRYYGGINKIDLSENPSGYKFMCSINLVGVPIVLFQLVDRIDITKI